MSALHLKREAEGMMDWHINVKPPLTSLLVHCFPGTQNKTEIGGDGVAKNCSISKKYLLTASCLRGLERNLKLIIQTKQKRDPTEHRGKLNETELRNLESHLKVSFIFSLLSPPLPFWCLESVLLLLPFSPLSWRTLTTHCI